MVAAMLGSRAYLLTYLLCVNTDRESDAPREGESDEKSKGEEEEGGREVPPDCAHFNVQNRPSTPSPQSPLSTPAATCFLLP